MVFLNPTYLWALLGLLVPITIHLWSKKEGKTIKVGSIELLRESESKQTSSIKPNEFLLLVIRMFTIALVTLVLAEPQLKLKSENQAITYLIEPSLLTDEKTSNIINTIEDESNIKLLAPGFPQLADVDLEGVTTETPNYWQLTKEVQTIASDSIVVYTKGLTSGFKGMRPSINKNIEWIRIDTESNAEKLPLKATKIDNSIEVLSMTSTNELTSFEKTLVKATDYTPTNLDISNANPLNILLYYEDNFIDDSKYLEASLNAVLKHINRTFNVTKTQDNNIANIETFDLVIWLSEKNSVPKVEKKLLQYKSDNLSNKLIEESTAKNTFYLTTHLNIENSIEHYLPEQLLSILDVNSDVKHIIKENDKRAFSKTELLPTFSDIKVKNKNTNYLAISKWLWLILGITLLGERILANYRKQ